ncbi:MAG: SDR family oxidoreductase [Rhodospirillales bacterium]
MIKRVLITGASSDIGLATCKKYQESGWVVIGQFRREREELRRVRGNQFEDWCFDFNNTALLESYLKKNREKFIGLSAFVNLAAEINPVKFSLVTPAQILKIFSINVLPGILLMQAIGPLMVNQGFGRIVHGSSIGVKFGGGELNFTYSLSKHILEFIPKEVQTWASNNVFVNVARIGATKTRIHSKLPEKNITKRKETIPRKKLATPSEIADAIFWLGSENNQIMSGEIMPIAGGE